jgi:hypothetical protein
MRRILLALAVALAVAVAAPLAAAHPHDPPSPDDKKGAAEVAYVLGGVVAADATETAVTVDVRWANGHMRAALAGATSLEAGIGAKTTIRLYGRARKVEGERGPRRWGPKAGTYADLTAGDRVVVKIRAPRDTAAADLPEATRIHDLGPPKPVAHVLAGTVAAAATADAVQVEVKRANRHMRRALDGATTVSIGIGADTRIRLVGPGKVTEPDGTVRRLGTYADLTAGDRVIVKIRAPRDTAAADLPDAKRIWDLGTAPEDAKK